MNTPQQEYSILHDSFGRSLPYLIKYAKQPTANTRTLFIFHGRDIASYSKFYDENWNIVCPLDHYGLDKKGSWFLGEHGDFFIKDLVIELIELVKSKTGSNRLYFWGSSMGGYAAILYGILFSAEAVYANVPFIKLTDCQIDLSEFRKPLDFVFGNNPLPEHRYLLDLTQQGRVGNLLPTLFYAILILGILKTISIKQLNKFYKIESVIDYEI